MKWIACLAALTLAACDALPRDPDGTHKRIVAARSLRVGVASPELAPRARALVAALARETGATPRLRRASLEPLIVDLDAGRIDLIVAEVAARTPWKTLVAPGPPLGVRGAGQERLVLRALVKNGENRWLGAVERASRRVAPGVRE